MTNRISLTIALLVSAQIAVPTARAESQTLPDSTRETELFRTVASLDSALFDSYNRCDLKKFASLFVDSVEFYHDQTGLMVGAQNVTEAIRKNICGKVNRDLVPGTLEVYPMNGYGAVEIGVHRFHPPNTPPTDASAAKFVMLWQNKNGVWKITRVISFNHNSRIK
jgi:hypothetical protein